MGDEESAAPKKHRQRRAGRKAEKKKSKDKSEDNAKHNPKAFAFNSATRAERRFRRKQDLNTKKQHIPLVDRTPLEPPPILVAVVGPPKVGKTTLINNLIKLFTKSPLTNVKGPVTIVIAKKRRLTFIECNNDINSMIDLAKVADLALLLCDASFGFEMEIFEFLNICQVSGMPRIMGVLTHLDMIKNSKTLKTTKKTLKHRFWTEVYAGAKLFYLSGIVHGEYLRHEIKNLGRFISCMKFRPLTWRSTHSYLLADRYEDLTSQETIRQNPVCNRNVCLYGYVRGVPLNTHSTVHIPGLGDLTICDISYLPDPCPLPDAFKKRALIEKEKLVYAPFSGVGGIVYDKDAVYVELGGSHSHTKGEASESNEIFANLIDTKKTLDMKMEESELQLFKGGEKITAKDVEDDKIQKKHKVFERVEDSGRMRRKVVFDSDDEVDANGKHDDDSEDDSENNLSESDNNEKDGSEKDDSEKDDDSGNDDSEDDMDAEDDFPPEKQFALDDTLVEPENGNDSSDDSEDDNMDLKWKDNLAEKAQNMFLERQKSSKNLMKLVYGQVKDKIEEEDNEEELGGLFRKISHDEQKKKTEKDKMDLIDSSLFMPWNETIRDWVAEENKELIKDCFVTGKWKDSEDAAELLKLDDMPDESDDDSEVFGDFEDLETNTKHTGEEKPEEEEEEKTKEEMEDEIMNNKNKRNAAIAEKKRKLKEKFDAEYDHGDESTYYDELKLSAERQAELNKSVFDNMPDDIRVQVEGFRAGMYVRVEFEDVPHEFVTNFDPTYPLIVGALNMGEENVGYVSVRIKKHRWHERILKTNDPLIISLGWRRFQTLPIYSKLEDNMKYRYLKYTPEHVTCCAHFWGPITVQGTGFFSVQSCSGQPEDLKNQGFRISATGVVQELDKTTQIMKKLKLLGEPMKIYKKTAFIKGMFNSALEVAKFEGAKIKTVSGIRGQIKKGGNKPVGSFRATFEDKIQLSDIVFCTTWCKVDVQNYYTTITNLLLPFGEKNAWQGLRTRGEVKRDMNIRDEAAVDSLYTEIKRDPKVFKPLTIPAKLQNKLPYRYKPKIATKAKTQMERVAVIREPEEQKAINMLKMIRTQFEHKQEGLKKQTKERLEKHRQQIQEQETRKSNKLKKEKKEIFRKRSKQEASTESKFSK